MQRRQRHPLHGGRLLRVRALIKMLRIPGAIIAYVCTSRPTARKLNWNPLKKLIHELVPRIPTERTCSCGSALQGAIIG